MNRAPRGTYLVELDAFSGRPNPRWRLTAQEALDLMDRVGRAQLTVPPAASPGLGYRGFVIYRQGATGAPVRWLRVARGTIWPLTGHGPPKADAGGLEQWLHDRTAERGIRSLSKP